MYTTIQKIGAGKILNVFERSLFYVHQGCICLIKYTVKTVILWNIIAI